MNIFAFILGGLLGYILHSPIKTLIGKLVDYVSKIGE